MPEFRRPRRCQSTGALFPRPGEDPGDIYEPTPEVPDIGVDRADPAFPHVVRALAQLAMHGFDAKDPDLIARAIEVGRAGLEHRRRQWSELKDNMRETSSRDEAERNRQRAEEIEQSRLRQEKRAERRELIYYMRIGDRCKIGYTRVQEAADAWRVVPPTRAVDRPCHTPSGGQPGGHRGHRPPLLP